ncbi:MAG: MFS transporter [Burkholderiales bacterium]|nr:MFS transporter [Burkholderiales bacterium]
MNSNLFFLALCQGLFLTNNVTFIAINGLVGLSLAPVGWMATLPVMGYVVGGALSTGLVAKSQAKWGRRVSFQLGLLVGLLSAILCAYAAHTHNFELLVMATMVAGYYSANGQLYRFAAAELAEASFREKAVSWVMAGGLIGAILGPNLASQSKGWFETPFMGAYVALTAVAVLGMVLMHFVKFPPLVEKVEGSSEGRPLSEIMKQPVFIVSAAAAALSFGVMNLLMAATPLAMQVCGFPFSDAALVLEWHVIGMFAPGFFTGHLIKKFGVLQIMVVFTGSTTLAMTAWRPEEKDRGQAAINFCVFATMAITSFASGALVTTQGWTWLNYGSVVPVALTAFALMWLVWVRKNQTAT